MSNIDSILYGPIGKEESFKVPDIWLSVIRQIRQAHPDWKAATIAGGALRDLDLGRCPKDVDIFLPYNVDNAKRLRSLFSNFALRERKHNSVTCSQTQTTSGVIPSHFHFKKESWNFEITQKEETFSHISLLDSFDLGICMICLDGEDVYRSPEYKRDVENKRITVIRKTNDNETKHAERIQAKYTDYTVISLP